jgi:hypothetical protein
VLDYAKYAAPGQQYLFDRQAVIQTPALNVLASMLLSLGSLMKDSSMLTTGIVNNPLQIQ